MGEQSEMKDEARRSGMEHCDILDRERLRIELDSPGGFFIRFQHLSIPLSEAEQASFLARYGERIQEVVSTGFQRIERTLNRILFLHEATDVLNGVSVRFQLKENFPAVQIGHFRAFVDIFLHAIRYDIMEIWFGSSDKSRRFRTDLKFEPNEPAGISQGISTGAWERHIEIPGSDKSDGVQEQNRVSDSGENEAETEKRELVQVGGSSSIGMDPVPAIMAHYPHDDSLFRYRPRLQLRDLDDCMFMPVLNKSLAEKLHSIQVFANGYKLVDIGPDDFLIDGSPHKRTVPDAFTSDELADPWVRIRPANHTSAFQFRFTSTTPRRMFGHEEPRDTPVPKTK